MKKPIIEQWDGHHLINYPDDKHSEFIRVRMDVLKSKRDISEEVYRIMRPLVVRIERLIDPA